MNNSQQPSGIPNTVQEHPVAIPPEAREAFESFFDLAADELSWEPEPLIKQLFDFSHDVVLVTDRSDSFLFSNLGQLGEPFAHWRFFSPISTPREKARNVIGGRISHHEILSSGHFKFAAFELTSEDIWGVCNGIEQNAIPVSMVSAIGGNAIQVLCPIEAESYAEYRIRCDILHRTAIDLLAVDALSITQTTLYRMPHAHGSQLLLFDANTRWNLEEPSVIAHPATAPWQR